MSKRSVKVNISGAETSFTVKEYDLLTDADRAALIMANAYFYNEETHSWEYDICVVEMVLRAVGRLQTEEN